MLIKVIMVKTTNSELYNGGVETFLLKVDKEDNLEMILVCCVIHSEIIVSKQFPRLLNIKPNIKCKNFFKFNAKCQPPRRIL